MAETLSPELRTFLTDEVRLARLGTLCEDGQPFVQPVWFQVDGDDIVMVLLGPSVTGRNARRDSRATVCVDDDQVPYAFAVIRGELSIEDDEQLVRPWMRKNIIRFRPDIRDVDAHENRLMALGVFLARLSPRKVFFTSRVSPDYE